MHIPFFDDIASSRNVLIAGAGGGYDIASGIPLYLYLRRQGKNVVLANLAFTRLALTESEEVSPGAFRVTLQSQDLPYFPEKYILEWLARQEEMPAMYGFSNSLGVAPLQQAYEWIIGEHQIDTLLLVDGGTDSLMSGNEQGVATIVEDACSIIASSQVGISKSWLMATAFGVDEHHGLDHYACLENIASLTRSGAFRGAVSLTKEMEYGQQFLELIDYLNQRSSDDRISIVANSIASALRGEYGDYHTSSRTQGSEQFINPFMSLLWFFDLHEVASRIIFRERVAKSQTMHEVAQGYQLEHHMAIRRPRKKIPL